MCLEKLLRELLLNIRNGAKSQNQSVSWNITGLNCMQYMVGITSFGHFFKHPRRLNILLLKLIESSREYDILNFCSFRGRYLCHGVQSVYQPASTELLLMGSPISISTICDVFSSYQKAIQWTWQIINSWSKIEYFIISSDLRDAFKNYLADFFR